MSCLYNYDPQQVVITFAGLYINEGFADGEFLRLEMDSEQFTKKVGVYGCVSRSKTNNLMASATLILAQGSPFNALLSAVKQADDNIPNGAGVAPFQVSDLNGSTLHFAEHAWIEKWPDATFDRETTTREWVFGLAKLENFIAGY